MTAAYRFAVAPLGGEATINQPEGRTLPQPCASPIWIAGQDRDVFHGIIVPIVGNVGNPWIVPERCRIASQQL